MNNFNALSQHIAILNQAVNSLTKNNIDITNRLKNLETGVSAQNTAPSAESNFKALSSDFESKFNDLDKRFKALSSDFESKFKALSSDFESKLEALSSEFERKFQEVSGVQTRDLPEEIDEIIIPEIAIEDDIIIGIKKEEKQTKKRNGKART